MPGLRAEGEVEQGVEQGGGIDRPLHGGLVGFSQWQEGIQGANNVPIGQNVVEVIEFEGGPAGLVEEDHEEGDEAEPEFRGAELARATGADLH